MAQILRAYSALSYSSRNEISAVLNSIINAHPSSFDASRRIQLISNIITDLEACGSRARLGPEDAALALLAVKTLAKDAAGSRHLASPTNLSLLLGFAYTFEDDHQASNEALRCIANALTLVDEARNTLIAQEVNGADACIQKLERSTRPDDIFVLSRILFLATASGTSHIETLVESEYHGRALVDIIVSKIDLLMTLIQNNTTSAKDALSDLLKFTNNILMYYTKSEKDLWGSSKLDSVLPPLLRAFQILSESPPLPITAPLTNVIHSLMYTPVTSSLRSVWFGASSTDSIQGPAPSATAPFDVLHRSCSLLDASLRHYFPGTSDPDECDVGTNGTPEDVLSPLVVFIAHLCIADETCRISTRQFIVPDDLDRSSPLEQRPDILGRCLRLLTCVSYPVLKDSIGEMLFAAADSDATKLSALVGYGNVAGHLFKKGVMSAPAPSTGEASLTTPSGEDINPITGTTFQPKSEGPEMTQEEKEAEAEKLFVLFDRLEKNGALSAEQNPIRKAIHEGKLSL